MPSSLTLLFAAAIVAVALFASAPALSLLQTGGERRRWPRLRRLAYAAAVTFIVLRAEGAALRPLFGATLSALLPLGRLPWLAVAGSEGAANSVIVAQGLTLLALAAAFGLPFFALGTAVGFGLVGRPTIRLRRALSLLLATSGLLLLFAFLAGSFSSAGGLDLGDLRDRVAAAGPACILWPLALLLLGLATSRLFPSSRAAEAPAGEDWNW